MNLYAKKSLGQHFLNSTHVLEQIIVAAHLKAGEMVLEIGPGTGILTRALLAGGVNVVAIEKDSRAINILQDTFKNEIDEGRLKLYEGDILEMSAESLTTLLQNNTSPTQTPHSTVAYSLIANIPYYITGAILEKFLEYSPRPTHMVLLVQKEVAERIVARDGKQSILSTSVHVFGTPRLVAKVPPGAFTPPPTVDSAILTITDISDRLFTQKNVDISRFFEIVKAGFSHKRKYALRNIEGGLHTRRVELSILESIWHTLGLDPRVRAEDMTVQNWIDITSHTS